jgi:hypothetical protein
MIVRLAAKTQMLRKQTLTLIVRATRAHNEIETKARSVACFPGLTQCEQHSSIAITTTYYRPDSRYTRTSIAAVVRT